MTEGFEKIAAARRPRGKALPREDMDTFFRAIKMAYAIETERGGASLECFWQAHTGRLVCVVKEQVVRIT